MNTVEQQFLNDLDKKLWTAANKLLPMLDAAVYKHDSTGFGASGTAVGCVDEVIKVVLSEAIDLAHHRCRHVRRRSRAGYGHRKEQSNSFSF